MTDTYEQAARFHTDAETLGPCCGCLTGSANNVLMLPRKAPVEGTGWGCIGCGLGPHGALAVLCDECVAAERDPVQAVYGRGGGGERIGIDDFPFEAFDHGEHDDEPTIQDEAKVQIQQMVRFIGLMAGGWSVSWLRDKGFQIPEDMTLELRRDMEVGFVPGATEEFVDQMHAQIQAMMAVKH